MVVGFWGEKAAIAGRKTLLNRFLIHVPNHLLVNADYAFDGDH